MKFTIEGYSQARLIALGLDNTDALILRYFADFYLTGGMTSAVGPNGKEFVWMNYKAVIEDLPCIGVTAPDSMARRFKKMVACGVLDHYHHKTGGSYSMYRIGPMYGSLVSGPPTDQKSEGYGSEVGPPTDQKSEQKTLLLENTSTTTKDSIADLVLKHLNEKTGSRFSSHKGTGLSSIIKTGVDLEQIKAVIDFKVKEWSGTDMAQYLTPSTLFRVSNFEKYENALRLPKGRPGIGKKIQFGFEKFDPNRKVPDEVPM